MRNQKGKNNPNYKDGRTLKKYYCKQCNKKVSISSFFYGSRLCKFCARRGSNNGNYKHGKTYNNKCIDCNKICSPKAIRCKKCSKQGILSPFYIHGKGYELYSKEFIIIRERIRKRDNYKCQICFKKAIDVHHIDYDKNNNKATNLIVVCEKCNIKANHNRDYWYSYFIYLINLKIGEKMNRATIVRKGFTLYLKVTGFPLDKPTYFEIQNFATKGIKEIAQLTEKFDIDLSGRK